MPTTLILTMVGLLFLLVALVFIYVWIARSREIAAKGVQSIQRIETFESLSAMIKNSASSGADLHLAVEGILNHFSIMTPHTIKHYQGLLQTLCLHPHTDSKLILQFERGLRSANPQYEHEIEHALAVGLAARK